MPSWKCQRPFSTLVICVVTWIACLPESGLSYTIKLGRSPEVNGQDVRLRRGVVRPVHILPAHVQHYDHPPPKKFIKLKKVVGYYYTTSTTMRPPPIAVTTEEPPPDYDVPEPPPPPQQPIRKHVVRTTEAPAHDIRDDIPGEPGLDYPVYVDVPKTNFSCEGRNTGFFADPETGCQVYHRCTDDPFYLGQVRILQDSFLCVNGTLFNQQTFTCDWWPNVDCNATEVFYSLNDEIGAVVQSPVGSLHYLEFSGQRIPPPPGHKKPNARIIPKKDRKPLDPKYRSDEIPSPTSNPKSYQSSSSDESHDEGTGEEDDEITQLLKTGAGKNDEGEAFTPLARPHQQPDSDVQNVTVTMPAGMKSSKVLMTQDRVVNDRKPEIKTSLEAPPERTPTASGPIRVMTSTTEGKKEHTRGDDFANTVDITTAHPHGPDTSSSSQNHDWGAGDKDLSTLPPVVNVDPHTQNNTGLYPSDFGSARKLSNGYGSEFYTSGEAVPVPIHTPQHYPEPVTIGGHQLTLTPYTHLYGHGHGHGHEALLSSPRIVPFVHGAVGTALYQPTNEKAPTGVMREYGVPVYTKLVSEVANVKGHYSHAYASSPDTPWYYKHLKHTLARHGPNTGIQG